MSSPISLADAARPERGVIPASLTNPVAATMFTDAGGSAIVVNLTGAVVPVDSDSPALPKVYQNKPFDLKAWGQFTGGTTTNLTIRILTSATQISATDGSNTATSISTGAVAVNSVSGGWMLEAELMWSTLGLKIAGIFWGFLQGSTNTSIAQTLVTPFSLTAAQFAANGMSFGVDAIFSATNAGNVVTLEGFDIDPL